MKKLFLLIGILFIFGCGNNKVEEKKQLIIPAYFYDPSLWDNVKSSDFSGVVIINPDNGVGEYSSYWDDIINSIQNKNPIGYVYTKYGERNLSDVENEIDKWLENYKIRGFFIDEVNGSNFNYYQEIFRFIKSKGNYKIVLNPGSEINESFFNIADIVVIFENSVKEFNESICAGTFTDKKAAIVYGASYDDFLRYKNCACRYIYFTDDNLPNPYDTLPSYFDEEVRVLKQ
ncbi:spherulation-specific family 4 protein [Caminibacter sp.]